MEHFAGIDVSLEHSSVCVVDGVGKIVREAKVASAGTISRMPERTINIDSTVAASEKRAQRRAQMASRDVGSSANRRRAMLYPGTRVRTAQSGGAGSGLDVLT